MNFQIISLVIFILAIIHTFLTPSLYSYSQKLDVKKGKHYHFFSEIIHLLSEVEIVFGIWLIPMIFFFTLNEGWQAVSKYLNTRDYSYAIYITVVLVVIGSRPIIMTAEKVLDWMARIGGDSPQAWWWTILIVGPLLGAILKEPAAMALCAILLSRKFYPYSPTRFFQYATLGLLFANISVGGMLTTFSSRALFIVADRWNWSWSYMLTRFGWKVLIGMAFSTTLYYLVFKKEFRKFPKKIAALEKEEKEHPVPFWITCVHLAFFALVILSSQTMPIFIGIFLLFLAFWKATPFYQSALHLKSAVLIGFFFASLIVHGELQEFWIIPMIQNLSDFGAMLASFVLSAFMDNAIVSYITLDIAEFDDLKHYLVITGAMSAGALTLIANVPNPIGHAILRPSFKGKISFFGLFCGALIPSMVYFALFWFFR